MEFEMLPKVEEATRVWTGLGGATGQARPPLSLCPKTSLSVFSGRSLAWPLAAFPPGPPADPGWEPAQRLQSP